MKRPHTILSRLPAWLLTAATLALIFWLTLSPKPFGDEDLPLFPGADKIAHTLMFGFLTAMILLDHQRCRDWRRSTSRQAVTAAVISSLIGIVIEFIQKWMNQGRGLEIADMASDVIGASLVATLWLMLQRHWLPATGKGRKPDKK